MPDIDLVYDPDCPNAEQARTNLRLALETAGMPARWREWVRTDPGTPLHLQRFGSPTILIRGRDVIGTVALDGGGACRIYQGEDRNRGGVPPVSLILAALRTEEGRAGAPQAGGGMLSSLAVLPGTLAAFLPALACPACWPAYAGVLSALGIGFLWEARYLLPLTVALLAVALTALAHGAGQRRGRGPFVLGTAGSLALVFAKFVFEWAPVAYAATGLILAASIWNAWPRSVTRASCPSCAPASHNNSVDLNGGSR